MKEKIPVNTYGGETAKSGTPSKPFSDGKKTEPPARAVTSSEASEGVTYSELLTSDHECPLSSILNLPLSKGATDTITLASSTVATTFNNTGEQFIPVHYPYHQEALRKPDVGLLLPDVLSFQSQEQAIQSTFNPHAGQHTSYFQPQRVLKEAPSFHEVAPKSDDSTKKVPDMTKDEKLCGTRTQRISLPLKFGENSRKRQRTSSNGVKSAFQRKMEHLDKEKERRLRQTKCYDYLRNLVPCGSLKTDKANILEVTVAYLTYIKETLGTSMDVIDKNFVDDLEKDKNSSNSPQAIS